MAQSIKLGNNTYLDSSGVVKGNKPLNTVLSNQSITITKVSAISAMECVIQRYGNVVAGYLVLTVGSTALGDLANMATGFPAPAPSSNRWQGTAVYYDSNTPRLTRIAIQSNGTLQLWYGGGVPAGSIIIIHVAYIAVE